jgi:ABC-2 type transport system ATP-binding protein
VQSDLCGPSIFIEGGCRIGTLSPSRFRGTMHSTVALQTITKRYGDKIAVDQISLRIAPGSMFGLLGPNGAGKTSTIRMMTGITMPDSGTVSLFDRPFERNSLRRVGYLPEERGLYRKMLVRDQLVFLGRLHGLSRSDALTRSERWAHRLQIAEALDKKTEELSKGMQQKIQFIATLLHEPELIIMDEPFSGLDPINAILLEDTLLQLKREGRSILFSTHRMDQVEKLCDAIALVNGGRVVLEGSMREVKSRYTRERLVLAMDSPVPAAVAQVLGSASIAAQRECADHLELQLAPGADPHELLRVFVTAGALITRWELQEPSLEEIFVRTVGGRVDA